MIQDRGSRRIWAFLAIFILGLALRIGILHFIPGDLIPPDPDWETGAVSISFATTGEMADPYLIPTGPTAHVPPLYPAAMGLLYRALGAGFLGGLIRWILVAVAGSLLWALMPWIAEWFGVGWKVGLLAGIVGSFFLGFPSELEPYSALALALLMVGFLRRWRGITEAGGGNGGSFLLGVAAGIGFHLQPVLLPVVLGYMVFELWTWGGRSRFRPLALMALGMALACLPWGLRNYHTFHQFLFIRSNFGLELYVGNHDGAHADIDVSVARGSFQHPRTDRGEAERVAELGEGAYMREKQAEALNWIRAHRGEFLKLTATRFLLFWAGPVHDPSRATPYLILMALALVGGWRILPRLDRLQRAALLIPLGTYPLVYYVVAYMPRYGEPVRWVLVLLAAGAILGIPRSARVGSGLEASPPDPLTVAHL